MSDVTTPETGSETPTDEAPTEPVEAPRPTETVDFWKQKAREQEARAKANASAAQRLQEYEESQKSESQRLADATARAQRDAEDARAESLRYKVAATHKVTTDYFDLLGSGDEETLTGRAQRIGSLLQVASENEHLKAELEALKTGKTPSRTRPVADLKPGATPNLDAFPDDTSYPASWLPQQRQSSN